MALHVSPPEPPRLETNLDADDYEDVEVMGDDYKREELQAYLDEGAWGEAFDEWAADTELDEEEWEIVTDLGMTDHFDFFWDDFADRVGYHAPGISENWKERDLHPALDSWGTVSAINASLTELGRTVSDTLKAEYIEWESEFEAPDDLPEFD